ncbi:response regulator transcription factor [Planomicrobium sp. MB-3u-38]|uniref:response regulator transcription factor n=1 Tax=Planomicrobium sp. MB-3u-38 TaxID=2058318 RepID=UPI000C7CDC79|nr:response regulator transcription factor [Planomicrobium sp. MB-3u-38]PKH11416.1 DNA-binding response regulator [Planomicrobium sp. MB-3u-38]
MQKKILIIEDEQSIATLLSYNLKQAGYETIVANDGKEGFELALKEAPSLIVLDLMLPSMDGVEICKELRLQKVSTPIIMLTAKDDEFDKVLGLELGADDYMTKPFSPREVVARIKAVLRRSEGIKVQREDSSSSEMKLGELKVYTDRYEAFLNDEQLEFTPKEFELLVYLMENKNRVLTRDQLLSAVWKYDFAGDTRIVDVHISHLREKIEENSRKPVFIKTIRGLGYKFEEPKAV